MNKTFITKIIEGIQQDPYFAEFKYRKKDYAFIKKDKIGFEKIVFFNHDDYDLKRDCLAKGVCILIIFVDLIFCTNGLRNIVLELYPLKKIVAVWWNSNHYMQT